jgi:hypothetical protein
MSDGCQSTSNRPILNVIATVLDSQTTITEPDRYKDEQGEDDVDEEDSADEK